MEKAPLHKIIMCFQQSFQTLEIQISNRDLEHLALLVYNSMSGERRIFHSPEHTLEVCTNLTNPLQTLAALFHDVVYFQIDGGFPPQIRNLLSNYVEIVNKEVFILEKPASESDTLFEMLLAIYDFHKGQKLSPFNGLNEFLSSLVAVKELSTFLPAKYLLGIGACIEATIPFRLPNSAGKSHFEQLADKLAQVNQIFSLGLETYETEEMVKLAVEIANEDVINFSNSDTGSFLDNTWLLIFESNNIESNLEGHSYSIVKYRQALMKTEGFIGSLNPESIFHEYKGVPNDITFQKLRENAQHNILIAREYLGVKLLTAIVLEALAMTTGGDAPMALLTGGIRTSQNMIERAEDFLPALSDNSQTQFDTHVLNLLEYGRSTETDFDMKNAPLAAFIYKSLGTSACAELLQKGRSLFGENPDYQTFLQQVAPKTLSAIAKACAHIAVTRQAELQQYFRNSEL